MKIRLGELRSIVRSVVTEATAPQNRARTMSRVMRRVGRQVGFAVSSAPTDGSRVDRESKIMTSTVLLDDQGRQIRLYFRKKNMPGAGTGLRGGGLRGGMGYTDEGSDYVLVWDGLSKTQHTNMVKVRADDEEQLFNELVQLITAATI